MVKNIALVAAVAVVVPIAGVLGLASTKPETFRIERSVLVAAPAERLYPLVSDFRQWAAWSPFEKLDPNMKKTFSGAERGQGAVYAWSGEGHAGEGRMAITEAIAPSKVLLKLDFTRPFEASNMTEFTFVPEGNQTKVTWAMSGPNTFFGKVMSVFISMDAMLGKDFDAGLAAMKAIAEK
jgi:uncharacterized protein YndB with AHSA1/START domain